MGVDYNGIGGVGIELTVEMIGDIIKHGLFTEEEWDDDAYSCVEEISLPYSEAGSSYSGEKYFYLLVHGDNLVDINSNVDSFLTRCSEIGLCITRKDLLVISDIRIW